MDLDVDYLQARVCLILNTHNVVYYFNFKPLSSTWSNVSDHITHNFVDYSVYFQFLFQWKEQVEQKGGKKNRFCNYSLISVPSEDVKQVLI